MIAHSYLRKMHGVSYRTVAFALCQQENDLALLVSQRNPQPLLNGNLQKLSSGYL